LTKTGGEGEFVRYSLRVGCEKKSGGKGKGDLVSEGRCFAEGTAPCHKKKGPDLKGGERGPRCLTISSRILREEKEGLRCKPPYDPFFYKKKKKKIKLILMVRESQLKKKGEESTGITTLHQERVARKGPDFEKKGTLASLNRSFPKKKKEEKVFGSGSKDSILSSQEKVALPAIKEDLGKPLRCPTRKKSIFSAGKRAKTWDLHQFISGQNCAEPIHRIAGKKTDEGLCAREKVPGEKKNNRRTTNNELLK